ncbi:MAG: alpha/beta hydrolase-fold protein [Proteobacteria bacterium]|nr:alpha/beta hydrolase-fold protein [Pseudomonadota bacterium]
MSGGRLALVALLATACNGAAPPPPPAAVTTAPAPARVETRTFHTDALGVDKAVVVYLPAGYDASARRYPVFYYLHGLGGNETDWTTGGHLREAADAMALAAIVVMPDGDNSFYVDSARPVDYDACRATGAGMLMPDQPREHTCVRASHYASYIQHDLVRWVDATYRTIATREGRGVAGLSMGGFGALELGMRFPDTFAAAASHSGVDALLFAGPMPYVAGHPEQATLVTDVATWGAAIGPLGDWIRALLGPDLASWRAVDPATLATTLAPGTLALYLDCGTEDDLALNHGATYLHDVLTTRKIEHAFFLGPGGHDFGFWRARLPSSLAFLRDHLARP